MYVLSKVESQKTKVIGVFRTKKGAIKVKRQRVVVERKEPKCFIIEHRNYYTTEQFIQTLIRWHQEHINRKYYNLLNKRNKIDRKLKMMRGEK